MDTHAAAIHATVVATSEFYLRQSEDRLCSRQDIGTVPSRFSVDISVADVALDFSGF